jgi:type I restriction enzyme S subunit
MKAAEKMVPELRFKEFDDQWQENKLSEIGVFKKGKGISKSDIDENGILECIRYGELYTTYTEIISKVVSKTNIPSKELILSEYNDVIIPASGESNLDIATASCVLKSGVAYSGDLNIIRTNLNGVFLSFYLNNKRKKDIASLAQGVSVVHLYSSQLKTLKINIPSLPEQQKIANFLSAVDQKIQQLQRKKELLFQYKKGMMQKLFSQEIRFKPDPTEASGDEQGNDFPEWEEKKLGDFIQERSEYPDEELPLYSLTIENGIVPKSDRYERSFLVKKNKKAYKVMRENDFAFNPMNLRFGALARHKEDKVVSVSKYYNIFYCNELANNLYFETFLTSYNMIQYYNKMATGSLEEKKRVHYLDFVHFKLPIPSLPEQQKIANFLSALDNKVAQVGQQIEQAQRFKKGLLQKMFV